MMMKTKGPVNKNHNKDKDDQNQNNEKIKEDGRKEMMKRIDDRMIDLLECFKYCPLDKIIEFEIPIYKYKDDIGANALHVAAAFGRNDIIQWLYDNRYERFYKYFSMHSTDLIGYTALHYAALNGHVSTIRLLKELGLDSIYNPKSNPRPFLNHIVTLYKFGREFKFGQFIKEMQISIETLKQANEVNKTLNNNGYLV